MKKYTVRILVNAVGERKNHKLTVESPTLGEVKSRITDVDGKFIIVDLPMFGDQLERTYINLDHVVEITISEKTQREKDREA